MAKMNEVTLDEALSLAKKHHENGNLTLADRVYQDILNSDPEHFFSLHYLGIIAYQRGAPDEGVNYLKKAININEDNPETWNAYGVMLEMTGNVEQAYEAWEKALKIKPKYPDALSNYANACWKENNFKKAQEFCERAIETNPNFDSAYINLGSALSSQGKIEEAIEQWNKALELQPDSLHANVNIGNALRDLGRLNESEEYCLKALEIEPENPDAMINFGNVKRDQGEYQEAANLFKKATDLRPDFVQAHINYCIALMDLLRHDEALIAARYALAFDPNNADAYGHSANILREQGKADLAEPMARKALMLAPESTQAKLDLAEVLFQKENFAEAITLFEDAKESLTDSAPLHLKIGTALERANRTEEAIESMQKAIELSPENPQTYVVLGSTYLGINKTDEALEVLNKAIEIKSDYPEALSVKSEILQSMGDMEEAKKYAMKALEIDDDVPSIYLTYSKLTKFESKDDKHLQKMESLVGQTDKYGQQQLAPLHYALFSAYENIKDYDSSFENLEKGANYKRESVIYNPKDQAKVYQSIIDKSTPEYLDSFNLDNACQSDVPVFIIGMPRSGTTLTEQIIASHPDVFGAGELYALGQVADSVGILEPGNEKEFGEQYLKMIQELHPDAKKAKRVTDKMPGNYARLNNIYASLPNAKIIHCRRNPIDTCLSCYKQLFSRGHYWSYRQDELANHYKIYSELMNHWREVMPDRFLEINYEDTINDFENQARKLIDYVGLEWNDACLTPHKSKRSVLTASKGQVRKPIYKTSIEAWRRYEKQLEPLATALKDYC